jgi:hypothetical protein
MRATMWPAVAALLAALAFAAVASAAPSPDPAPDPAPPPSSRSASPPASPPPASPTPPPSPAPDPLEGVSTTGGNGGITPGGAFVLAHAEVASVASIVDAVPVASRSSERIDTGSGALSPETLGLLLSLLLLGLASTPRWALERAGHVGFAIGSRRSMIAIVGLAVAVGALVNVLIGSAA